MAVNLKRANEMESFWNSLPSKVKAALYRRNRRLIMSSDDIPLLPYYPSRFKSLPKYYLFDDVFVVLQGTTLIEYPLEWIWVQHIINNDPLHHTSYNMASFRVTLPESHIDLQCKEFVHKSMWVSSLIEAISQLLQITQVTAGRGDLTMDTKLELIRGREFMQYTFQTLPELKDVRYKGQWLNAKPHGVGEFWHEPSGKLYKGGFKKGKFHGKGELLWFADSEYRKKYIGEFMNGKMDGKGEMKYSNGDVYDGQWSGDKREGFGRLEEASKKNSMYCGGWIADKRHGYGVYDEKMKHERYLGMWSENQRCGPGIVVTSTGTYCEAVFGNNSATSGDEGLILDLNGNSFMGKIGPDFKLAGKGILTLNNGVTIEGYFGGTWHGNIDIQRATLSNSRKKGSTSSSDKNMESWRNSLSELQIAKLDKRIGTCTVLASNKWHPLYEDCERMLGFSGNAASDVLNAWSRIAEGAFERRSNQQSYFEPNSSLRRASSLNTISKTVRAPGELISLERARAMTLHDESSSDDKKVSKRTMDDLEASLMKLSIEHSSKLTSGRKIKISGPLHLQEEMVSSYPPVGTGLNYSPQADRSPSSDKYLSSLVEESGEELEQYREEKIKEICLENETSDSSPIDTNQAIQRYIDQAFNTPTHPLGILMNQIEMVFRDSYGGIGANKFLLPHAISEVQYIIKRFHSIIRILFPFLDGNDRNITAIGLTRLGETDPDDYVCINSGYTLLHPLVFQRIFPTLKMLYILHHSNDDKEYSRGIEILSQMNTEKLAHFIHFPQNICKELLSENNTTHKDLLDAATVLQRINTLYTPGEFLDLFRSAFEKLSNIQKLSCDVLLPSVVFIVVKASVSHLGAYLHFLTDFAHTEPADEYTLVTYEAAYNFIRRQDIHCNY